MRTQDDIENERAWTSFAALCLLFAFLFGAIGVAYFAMAAWLHQQLGGSGQWLAYAASLAVSVVCALPGVLLWLRLRRSDKRAALFGLALIAALSIGVGLLVGTPLRSNLEATQSPR